jgi:hypothetical protein
MHKDDHGSTEIVAQALRSGRTATLACLRLEAAMHIWVQVQRGCTQLKAEADQLAAGNPAIRKFVQQIIDAYEDYGARSAIKFLTEGDDVATGRKKKLEEQR